MKGVERIPVEFKGKMVIDLESEERVEWVPTKTWSYRVKPHTSSSGRDGRGKHRQLVKDVLKKTAKGWEFGNIVRSEQ